VKIWYDVSDLMSWHRAHLTGIQRTTTGILNGLVDCGQAVELVRYDARAGRFCPVDVAALPAAVRRHLRVPGAEGVLPGDALPGDTPAAVPAGGDGRSRRRRRRGRLLGKGPAAEELRAAFREFKRAARELSHSARHWATERFGGARRDGLPPRSMRGEQWPLDTRPEATDFFGDSAVLLSLGAGWCLPGHAAAVALVRSRGVKVVRMVYDLIPALQPHWVEPVHARSFALWARAALTDSDHVLTISEFSRQEIERYCAECHFLMPDVAVVRLGDVIGAADASSPPPLPRFVPQRPFFLCVSTLDVRKNHRLLYDAWTLLASRRGDACPDLLCVGIPHLHVADLMHEIRGDRHVNRNIHLLHAVEDAELAWYYKHCQATIYPSKYEGWGLPVAESLGLGRLCLAANATSIPEISPDLPAFFDPCDVHGVVELVDRVLDDPAWVRSREEAIEAEFKPTAWRETAARTLEACGAEVSPARLSVWRQDGTMPGVPDRGATAPRTKAA
jgi:glycosyltransferase involved in cell wall biosynthesis